MADYVTKKLILLEDYVSSSIPLNQLRQLLDNIQPQLGNEFTSDQVRISFNITHNYDDECIQLEAVARRPKTEAELESDRLAEDLKKKEQYKNFEDQQKRQKEEDAPKRYMEILKMIPIKEGKLAKAQERIAKVDPSVRGYSVMVKREQDTRNELLNLHNELLEIKIVLKKKYNFEG